MARRGLVLTLLGLVGYLGAIAVPSLGSSVDARPSAAAWFSLRGKVVRIVDGDTLRVKLGTRTERVRLIGVDAPEVGGCYAAAATAALRGLAANKRVRLIGDRTQTRRDRYSRLLAYVVLPNGVDAGRQLLLRGYATLYETSPPFARHDSYADAAATAAETAAGVYGTCGAPPPPTTTEGSSTITTATSTATTATTTTTATTVPPAPSTGSCAASYPDVCIPPPPPDLDCGQIAFRNFRVIYNVPSPDPHRFDGDRDGIGCES